MILIVRRFAIFLVALALLITPWMAGGRLFGEYLSYVSWLAFAGLFLFYFASCFELKALELKPVAHWPWLLPYAAVSFWIAVQLFVLPGLVGNVFGAHAFSSPITEGLDVPVGPVNWYESIHYWGLFTTYWAVAYFTFCLNRHEARFICIFLAAAVIFQFLYAIFFSKGGGWILGLWVKERFVGGLTGTYVHPNHFSGFIAMLMPMGVAALIYFTEKYKSIGIRVFGYGVIIILILWSSFIILSLGTRLSMAAIVMAWFVFLWLWLKHKFNMSLILRVVLIFGVGGAILLFYVIENLNYFSSHISKFSRTEGRFGLWENIARLPDYIWIWGGGAGTFGDVYVLVARAVLSATRPYEEAHNDYYQFLVEFGYVGAGIVFLAGVVWIIKAWPKHEELSIFKIGAVAGIVALLIRLVADFDMQLPGTAICFWAIVGLYLNPNLVDRQRKKKRKRRSSSNSLQQQAFADVYEDAPT